MAPAKIFFCILSVALLLPFLRAQSFDYHAANLSTLWTNTASLPHSLTYGHGSAARAILLPKKPTYAGPSFAAGFFCTASCEGFLFAVFTVNVDGDGELDQPPVAPPQVVWSANRVHLVRENATLQFTSDGDLVLRDADRSLVWSTNTTGQSVASLMITEIGNLVLFNQKNLPVWQSFDHTTNSLAPGQSPPTHTTSSPKKGVNVGVILNSTIAAAIALLFLTCIVIVFTRTRLHQELDEEDDFDQLSGMPTRFSFEKLRIATEDFSQKLGEGGFGSVFEGRLDGERVAVKHLDGAGQGKKEFLAEVQAIGSIHHINLVRMIGFCAEKSHRLLVFEYMPKGSLDKWIYCKDNSVPLDWQTRCRIVINIAKGLSYLHEECRQRIAHLDIKPHNILLDDNFNAKVADFGLSKLIERDTSQVMTRMRGTPGYLAPEWLTSHITEKVDVYSFGVVVMEIISGRKSIDHSLPEESFHLIRLLQEKAKNDQLIDMIDKHSDDMHIHREEVIQMIKLAMWCLQSDSNRRPPMSSVVKVLEGAMDIETNIDYDFFNANPLISAQTSASGSSGPPVASVLSRPR